MQISGNGTTLATTSFDLIQNSAGAFVLQRDNNPLIFGTNNTERVRITSGGNVLVGTTTDEGDKLTVNGNISIFGNKIYNGASSNSAGMDFAASSVRLWGYDGIKFYASAAGIGDMSERMRITSGGELLINTTSDAGDYKLQVNGNILSLGFVAVSGANDGLIVYQNGGSANLPTYTSNTDRAQINFKYAQNFPASNNYTRTLDIVSTGDGTGGGMTRFFTTTNNS